VEQDYYNLLGIPFDATGEEIRNAYFDAARLHHPDANHSEENGEVFLAIQEAFEVLSNPKKRAEYDRTLPETYHTKSALVLHSRFSRNTIPLLGEPQVVYALLELTCTAETDPLRLPSIDLCLVVDRSTSMAGDRLMMVKDNIEQLLNLLRPQDIFSIVTFSDRAEVFLPPTRVGDLNRKELRLNQLIPSGATEIFQGLNAGFQLFTRGTTGSASRQIVLMTDGHTYGDEEACYQLANEAAEQGILINALGFGSEWNDGFLDQLCAISGGNASYVISSKDLYTFFEQKMRSLENLYARQIQLKFESDPAVQLRYAFRIRPEISPLPISNQIPLGGLHYGKQISIMLEFVISPLKEGITEIQLAKGKISMEIPSMPVSKHRLLVDLKRPVRTSLDRETPPAAILDAMSVLSMYKMQEKVRQEVGAGNIAMATRHLHHLATHLLARGERKLAQTVLLEAEYLQQNRTFSAEGDKRIKYGTRSLLMLLPAETMSS